MRIVTHPPRDQAMNAPSTLTTRQATEPRVAFGEPVEPSLAAPDGRPTRVVHLVAELAPFARSGGLGEAVASLARFQSASGVSTAIVMPLYDRAREAAADMEPVGPAFRVDVGPRSEVVRLWKHVPHAGDPLAQTDVYFLQADEYFARPHIYGPPGSD